jgi:hypothetical protein
VHEGEAATLAAERAGSDAGEGNELVESRSVEVGDHVPLDRPQVRGHRGDEVGPQICGSGELGDLSWPDRRRQLELGARLQPGGEVVAARVVHHGGVRNRRQHPDHLAHVRGAGDLLAPRQLEDEIAEAVVVENVISQLLHHGRGVFPEEIRSSIDGPRLVRLVRGLEQDRNVIVAPSDLGGQSNSRLVVVFALARIADVGDDAEQIPGEPDVQIPGLVEGLREEDLRPCADAEQAV